ncbi:MAG: glycosyltransferase family 1 protein, partial [Alteraurantiacibacter sp. bin_em_oilr2.035]|nr:glycosyltransferase family 1 protein [Alteraurantiacibacter sp. bin_em_oilr2.035]
APANFPLRNLPARYLPGRELILERTMRLTGLPRLNWVGTQADWYYSPMESPMPLRGARTAMTLHDIAIFETELPWSRSLAHLRAQKTGGMWVPQALAQVDRVLTVSEFSRQRMIDVFGTDPDRIHVVGNGVEDAFFTAGDTASATGIDKTNEIVVLGGLRYKKGADHVLAVADALQRRGSALQVVTIGQNEPAYEARARDHPNIELLGMIPDAALIDRLTRARALMLLSLYEGFGIPALEAMACGTVAVVSDIASLPEVVGDAGLVFRPDHADEIAATLEQLSTDSAWHNDLTRRGREHARKYTWDRCTDQLIGALT